MRFLPLGVLASNSRAVKYSVATGVLVLATLFVWSVWYGLRYRGKPEPFACLSEPAFGRAGGLLVGIVVGLMSANVTQDLLRFF